jgi:hypothetical protein
MDYLISFMTVLGLNCYLHQRRKEQDSGKVGEACLSLYSLTSYNYTDNNVNISGEVPFKVFQYHSFLLYIHCAKPQLACLTKNTCTNNDVL